MTQGTPTGWVRDVSIPMFWCMIKNADTGAFQRDSGYECEGHDGDAFHWAASQMRYYRRHGRESYIEVWLPKGMIRIWNP